MRRRSADLLASCCVALAVVLSAGAAQSQDAPKPAEPGQAKAAEAQLVRVALPLLGSADDRIRRVVNRLVDELPKGGEQRPTIVFEFSHTSADGASSGFDRCFSLARFLASDALSDVRTVAYVPQSLTGHDVLPVLACEQIVIAPKAEFGAAGVDEPNVGAAMKAAYEEIASRRRTVPPAVAQAMLVADSALMRADTADGEQWLLERDLPELQKSTTVKSVDTISPQGELARFTGRQMRLELGLASHLADDYAELSKSLELPLHFVNTSSLLGDEGNAIRLDFQGEPTHQGVTRLIRLAAEAISRKNVNRIVLWIDSEGGEPAESMRLAQYLSELDPNKVQTIAYIPHKARGDAALVALACDQVVMGEQAMLGGAGAREFSSGERQSFREPIKRLAEGKATGWSLLVGLVDDELKLGVYRRSDAAGTRIFSEEELAEQGADQWELVAPLDLSDGVSAAKAIELGLANEAVGSDEEFLLLHGLPTDLEAAEPRWSDVLVDALARDELAYIMLFIAVSMLLAEVSAPGLGVPGFVAAVCFAMFFWSRFLHGTAEWLEVILFVMGAVFIVVEIFLVPGWGVFGVGGGIMILASIVLASQTFIVPTNLYQLEQLPGTLTTLLTGMAGGVAGLAVLRHLLPYTPGFNRVILAPPEGEELEQIRVRESMVDWSRFMGQTGTTTTRLIPAGKARFGRETIDVLSRGEMISAGQPVRVIEAVGNRVIVEPIE